MLICSSDVNFYRKITLQLDKNSIKQLYEIPALNISILRKMTQFYKLLLIHDVKRQQNTSSIFVNEYFHMFVLSCCRFVFSLLLKFE